MDEKRKTYTADDITVTWSPVLCIHAKECVNGLPDVFDIERKPWVMPDKASADKVAEVIERCPTGALQYERHDGGCNEQVPEENEVSIQKDGPLYMRGDLDIKDADGNSLHKGTRIALCRCGESKIKPFCDNTHEEIDWHAD